MYSSGVQTVKKYVLVWDKDQQYKVIYSDADGSLLENEQTRSRCWWTLANIANCLAEYKEPRVLSRWYPVIQRNDGTLDFGRDWAETKSIAKGYQTGNFGTVIDVVELRYEERI